MNFLEQYANEEIILVTPNELNSYILELRNKYPRMNFKLFTLKNLLSELRGNYLNIKAFDVAYSVFPEYTYKNIKETLELVFCSFKIEESNNESLIELKNKLEEEKLLYLNRDFINLLRSRKVVFINFKDSTLVKSIIKACNIKNYEFLNLLDVVDVSSDKDCFKFFNIFEESHYAINEILKEVHDKNSSSNIKIICNVNSYEFYIHYLLNKVDVPFKIVGTRTLLDSKTYKVLYGLLKDDSFEIIKFLNEHKEELDDPLFDLVYNELTKFRIDERKNKKTNVYEILSSKSVEEVFAKNSIVFHNSLTFSGNDSIYVLGLDDATLPSAKKNNTLYSYEYKNKLGLDSLDEVNLMKSNIEKAFLLQKNIKYLSFHLKDNNGKYNPSYYISSLKFGLKKAPVQDYEFNEEIAKTYYSSLVDKFNKTGENVKNLSWYYNLFKDSLIKLYNPAFKGLNNYVNDDSKSYSYSSLNNYNKCPFLYYLNTILKVGEFSNTTEIKIGNLAHASLMNLYEVGYDFKEEFIKAYQNALNEGVTFNAMEKILLRRSYEEIKKCSETLIKHKNDMSFKKSYSEYPIFGLMEGNFDIIKNGEVVQEMHPIKLYGRVDSMIQTMDDTLFIIDYKTGKDEFSKKQFIDNNECTQLPFYYTLCMNANNKELKDLRVDGCFIKPILINKGNFYNVYNPSKDDLDSLKFDGFFFKDFDSISKFDYSLIRIEADSKERTSAYINGLKVLKPKKKNDTNLLLGKTKNAVELDELTKFEQIIKEYILNKVYGIVTAKFDIDPLSKKGKSTVCGYCDFKDICMKYLITNSETEEEEDDA